MFSQIALLAGESILIAAFLLFLFRLRSEYGLSLLYVVLGGFQYIQALFILSVYVEILPHFLVSPGLAVMTTATLFVVLLVYIMEDGLEARKLIYGIALANVGLSVLTIMVSKHMQSNLVQNLHDIPEALFLLTPNIMVISTLVLVLDVSIILSVYRGLGRYLHHYQLVRIFLSLLAALTIDTFLFTSACFIQHPSYAGILYSNLMARFFVGGFYSVILALYIRGAERDRLNAPLWHLRFADLVSGVRYRGKYEALKKAFVRDVLTRVYSRGFFDEALVREMARSSRSSEPLSLMMVDIDLFKQVNDKHGHQAGDSVLRAVGALLLSSSRAFDLPCRYGGDEFAVILPSADGDQAYVLATRLQAALRERCARTHPDVLPAAVTFTIGVATFPDDAQNPDGLIKIADNRLYEGKHAGKNCIIRGETPVPPLSA